MGDGRYDKYMSQTAKTRLCPVRNVVIPLYEGCTLLDVAGPSEALQQANRAARTAAINGQPYKLHFLVCGPSDWVTSSVGLPLKGMSLDEMPGSIDTLLIPGAGETALTAALANTVLLDSLRTLLPRCRRQASVCTGAFLLAELGVLDRRRATTHWAGIATLAKRYPAVRVARDRLYERDGSVWTSAGVLSGVDMALALIEHDLNRETAMATARQLVAFLVRHGGQSQFSAPITLQAQSESQRLGRLVAFLQERLDQPCSVTEMADQLAMSERTLHRRCKHAFGLTPAGLLAELRLEHARALLLQADQPIKAIARASGYATPSSLSKAFSERYGVAPTRYREHFA